MINEYLAALAEMSNRYGRDASYVLAGGGNTSFKKDGVLYVKGSGTALATIKAEEFVRIDREKLASIRDKTYPEKESEREAAVLADMMAARLPGETRRPSVETLLHDLFPYAFVLHVHPALVNGLTCSKNGKKVAAELFPDAVWIENSKPGYCLAALCRERLVGAQGSGKFPQIVFLENHGIFFAADTVDEIDKIVARVMSAIDAEIGERPDETDADVDLSAAAKIAPVIRMLYGEGNPASVRFCRQRSLIAYDPETGSLSPDHIVYCKASPLILSEGDDVAVAFHAYVADKGYKPKVVYFRELGAFCCGNTYKEALIASEVFFDAVKICVYAKSFGGVSAMPAWLESFIVNWEVESYRSKVSLSATAAGRLDRKVVVVTGAAQGFGKGIAEEAANEGAYTVIADMNYDGAVALASTLPSSTGVRVNVTDEESVKKMIEYTVLEYGGIDVLVSNAGVARAGGLEEMTRETFDFVTSVNYTGYFLCAKYASAVMKIQTSVCPGYTCDIIEINSKSGLAGSNRNFAYAGSKFGGIGLTQSFALELAPYGIKVNAVCPGNYLDGPLWSDPERGLFVQYLNAGKVPGARTVEDVRRYYESKVPLGRGCFPKDVARAIFYIVEQTYETGQAIPVTGGQEMLK